MRISFHSTTGDEKTFYEIEATYENNILEFNDSSVENTTIRFEIYDNKIIMNRIGDVTMNMVFEKDKTTDGYYQNKMGLEFKFKVLCTNLFISNKKFSIDYQMIIDEEYTNEHKLWILFH